MLRLVDEILAASGPDAVIMIQGDEGPFPARYRANEWGFEWRQASDEELEEKFGILYAMRVPGADLEAAGFHDAITPVNTFRLIFNARFGTDLALLPDRTWAHEDLYHFYDFFEITDQLQLLTCSPEPAASDPSPARRHLSRRLTCSRRTPRPR